MLTCNGLTCVALIIFSSLLNQVDCHQSKAIQMDRDSKIFPFILGPTYMRFESTECKTDGHLSGMCLTHAECKKIGGRASGTCAKGVGCCCVIKKTCGDWSQSNCTYFTNPKYPHYYEGSGKCTITIKKCNPDVCQLRLDFLDFSLSQPDANGNCIDDFLIVSGGGSNVPKICGVNTGQHVYVDFRPGSSPIQISIDTKLGLDEQRKWNIKITQVKCCDRAPVGCLMYYTATSGKVMSFNYNTHESEIEDPVINGTGTRELANLNYGVCIRMCENYCSIEWSQNPKDSNSFTVTGNTDGLNASTPAGSPEASQTVNCTTDYIVIPNPIVNMTKLPTDRFCGNGLPDIISYTKPFGMTVVTNENELIGPPPDTANRGFCLYYRQLPCEP